MVFSSVEFLFYFLPVCLGCYFLSPQWLKNYVLLAFSLVFYAWGEVLMVFVLFVSMAVNYLVALRLQDSDQYRRGWLIFGVSLNLGILGVMKYADFVVANVNELLPAGVDPLLLPGIPLPIGVSFFTFHGISYLVDVYRGDAPLERRFSHIALYLALFPQLIAGPILRFPQVADDLSHRKVRLDEIARGFRIFIVGLGYKVLIANPLAVPADNLFDGDVSQLAAAAAWLGIVSYTLQIYFDFFGYSLMAIGLGLVFGFHFPPNFWNPYMSQSITEFWRRWHMTLSSWFRDYVYIPLGGSRGSTASTYRNLLIVFVLCGLWHGAQWTFLVWGVYHGAFLILERAGLLRILAASPLLLRHVYALLVVTVGWVFFRANTLEDALTYLRAMAGMTAGDPLLHGLYGNLSPQVVFALLAGLVLSTDIVERAKAYLSQRPLSERSEATVWTARQVFVASLAIVVTVRIMAGTYNPFIYFRF